MTTSKEDPRAGFGEGSLGDYVERQAAPDMKAGLEEARKEKERGLKNIEHLFVGLPTMMNLGPEEEPAGGYFGTERELIKSFHSLLDDNDQSDAQAYIVEFLPSVDRGRFYFVEGVYGKQEVRRIKDGVSLEQIKVLWRGDEAIK